MKNTYIGSPVERCEDLRFLRGRGTYVDDLAPANVLHAVILRSSVAHGRITAIDVSGALKAGVPQDDGSRFVDGGNARGLDSPQHVEP